MTAAGTVLMLLSGGLWAGLILVVAVDRLPEWSRMPVEQYAVDFRRTLRRLDPLAPILGGVSAIGSIIFAVSVGGPAAALAWLGFGLIAVVIAVSTAIMEPINSQFRRRDEGEVPPDAEAIRDRWRVMHQTRTVLAIAAFTALVVATVPQR